MLSTCLRMLWAAAIDLGSRSFSSFLVPDCRMFRAGQIRWFAIGARVSSYYRCFEFFEDDLIHSAAGVDEAACEDGEAAAIFDFPGCAE